MLIINSEYLVAPLFCNGNILEEYVEDLRILNEVIDDESFQVFKECNIVEEMRILDFYPSDVHFKKIISQDIDSRFSANDIVRVLFRLINAIPEYSNVIDNYEIEWKAQSTDPILSYLSDIRKAHYKDLFHKVIFQSILAQQESYVFSLQKNSIFNTNIDIEIDTGILLIEPEVLGTVPLDIKTNITVFGGVKDVIVKLNGYDIYKRADSAQSLKLAFYFGVLNYLSLNKIGRLISWDDFDIGQYFYESLLNNQCANTQQFSTLVYDTVIKTICRKRDELKVKPFRISENSNTQKTFEGLKGFRCHLTKGHEALRLMFWSDPETRKIIFANVGPKMELIISDP